DPETRKLAAAARELFEECGVLIARQADGSFPSFNPQLEEYRRSLMQGRTSFQQVLEELHVTVSADDFIPVGKMVTPPFSAFRYDSTFYLAHMPPGQQATVWSGELDLGCWLKPASLLDSWVKGTSLLTPPTLALLQAVRNRPVEDWPVRLHALMSDWVDQPL